MNEIIRKKSVEAYDEAKRLAASGNVDDRREVAGRTGVRPELLYFLAEDPAAEVREEIARNTSAPAQADALLATDSNENIRAEVAGKLTRSSEAVEHLNADQVAVVEVLARDQVTRIRKHLADALADVAGAPQALIDKVIKRLALDAEIEVAGVILERSPLLKDPDLIEVIAATPLPEAVSAVASRTDVGPSVADAIVSRTITPGGIWGEGAPVAKLLSNPSAQIREEALDTILDNAADQPGWHAPLTRRSDLPARALRRVAEVVTDELLDEFQSRHDFDTETTAAVATSVRQRMTEMYPPVETSGALPHDEDSLSDALLAGEKAAVQEAIAAASGLPLPIVTRIFESRSARAVTALAWKAGYSMRFAMQMQMRLAGIAPNAVLNARNGTDYPMTEDDMSWQLEFFGA